MERPGPYCSNPFIYRRRKTRTVWIGEGPNGPIGIGGDQPIRMQSMTTTDTLDTEGTIAQALRMVEAGCEIVRITAPKVKDAHNLGRIRAGLLERGVHVPLVADIHFLPDAAMAAADHVEKVRINPGNYADRKVFEMKDFSDDEYAAELERIAERFSPLVLKCKDLGRAMRIGTNHGSLSDRVMGQYGDSPVGMVESALEFVRICRDHDYHDIVLSMKASNPAVMIEANRLLAARLDALAWDYPMHLGVTEAGDGEDGRIKSGVGIGSLLADGIGDTIRVSLTEDPEFELPACADILAATVPRSPGTTPVAAEQITAFNPFEYQRRRSDELKVGTLALGDTQPPRVEVCVTADAELRGVLPEQRRDGSVGAADGHDGIEIVAIDVPDTAALAAFVSMPRVNAQNIWCARIPADPELAQRCVGHADLLEVQAAPDMLDDAIVADLHDIASSSGLRIRFLIDDAVSDARFPDIARRLSDSEGVSLRIVSDALVSRTRRLFEALSAAACTVPLTLECSAEEGGRLAAASCALGALLCDGIGDSIAITDAGDPRATARLAYNILQGTGRRITKTEFISCPSCGRTKFDLQITTERIKSKTGHLKDVRIAIMGCIVNGPGEMADADFGYVGAGTKRISLYVGKECVERDIPENDADERLIDLIKRHGRWVPPTSDTEQELEYV